MTTEQKVPKDSEREFEAPEARSKWLRPQLRGLRTQASEGTSGSGGDISEFS
jgi:hypothetical protein